jgi:predicted ribonuclease YlaK
MARRKRTNEAPSPHDSFTIGQIQRKKPINDELLLDITPLTENQKKLFDSYEKGKNIIAYGSSGTGKSFICLYNALKDVLNVVSPYETIYIVRSLVQTREIGFMPGDESQKQGYFEIPYKNMVKYMFKLPCEADFDMLYDNLKLQKTIKFYNTSFIRGLTLDNCIILVDEFANLNGHELDSIITRVGENSKIIFCGDASQSDLVRTSERNGIHAFMEVAKIMPSVDIIEFGIDDVCRSGLVKEYLTAKHSLDIVL